MQIPLLYPWRFWLSHSGVISWHLWLSEYLKWFWGAANVENHWSFVWNFVVIGTTLYLLVNGSLFSPVTTWHSCRIEPYCWTFKINKMTEPKKNRVINIQWLITRTRRPGFLSLNLASPFINSATLGKWLNFVSLSFFIWKIEILVFIL